MWWERAASSAWLARHYGRAGGRRYTDAVRAGVLLLSCLALTTNAWAQVRLADAPVGLAAPSPGSLLVSADPSACLAPSTLNLAGVSPHGSSNGIQSLQTSRCRWVVTGLPSGTYELGLTHARGSGGRVRFDLVSTEASEVRIPAPPVTVTGIVRINGEPVSGAQITFTSQPIQNGFPKVVTNQDGTFEATLPEAGPVRLRLNGNDVYGQSRQALFDTGENRIEWEITGGTLVIRDARGSRREPFSIDVWFENGFQGWSALLFPAGRELRGAPFGTHRIAIRRGVGVEEPIASVTISPDAPRAEAVLDVP